MFILSLHKLRSGTRKYVFAPVEYGFKSCPFTLSGHFKFSLHTAWRFTFSRSRLNWMDKQITNKFDFVARARNSWSIFSYGNWISPQLLASLIPNLSYISRRKPAKVLPEKLCSIYTKRPSDKRLTCCRYATRFAASWNWIINWMGIRCCVKTLERWSFRQHF